MDFRILKKRSVIYANCPECKTEFTLERVKEKTTYSKFMKSFGFKLYHCSKCPWEGRMFTYRWAENYKAVFINYLKLMLFFVLLTVVLRFLMKLLIK